MKLFKSVDDRLLDIGFVKQWDNDKSVVYTREDKENDYIHCLSIARDFNGRPSVISYSAALIDNGYYGDHCIELTYYEMKLTLKKMRQKRWKSK